MVKCSFCNKEIEKGTGKLYVRKDARPLHFCSSKCEKNMLKLRRVPRKMKWITKTKKEAKK